MRENMLCTSAGESWHAHAPLERIGHRHVQIRRRADGGHEIGEWRLNLSGSKSNKA
jgi:hypothetical protein